MAAETKKKVLLNRGDRTYHLKSGILPPGGALEVTQEDFDSHVGYRDLVDADKVVPMQADRLATANAKIAELEATIADLQKQIAEKNKKDK